MTPADHITFDGDMAWYVDDTLDEWIADGDLDRPCDTCDGLGWLLLGVDHRAGTMDDRDCPADCIDGRHTFEIKVECPTCDEHCVAYDRIYRVSIVPGMVLPIVKPSDMPDSGGIADWGNRFAGSPRFARFTPVGSNEDGEAVTLPSVAAPGMSAVKLRVAA